MYKRRLLNKALRLIHVVTVFGCTIPTVLFAQDIDSTSALRLVQAVSIQEIPAIEATEPVMSITLGEPQQIFHFRLIGSMGLFNVPDMHTAAQKQPDNTYLLWITGNIGRNSGSIARLSTKDFPRHKNAGPGAPTSAKPVMVPSRRTSLPRAAQRGTNARRGMDTGDSSPLATCLQNFDADYAGANSVITASNGKDLLMFVE